MSSSKDDFEALKQSQSLNTFEHVGYPDVFVTDPECLVVLYLAGQQEKTFGLHFCTVKELEDHIMFRATELCKCSMVDRGLLSLVDAKLLTPQGHSWFRYDPEDFVFRVSKEDEDSTDSAS